MKYKGIIFDLDGTLANTLEDIAGSMNTVLVNHGYSKRPVDDYRLLVGRGLDNLVRQSLPESAQTSENVAVCLHDMMEHYENNCLVKTRLYDGIREMLGRLRDMHIPMAVFSNKADLLTVKIVRSLLPGFPFVEIMGAKSGLPKKPDPAGALLIAGRMQLSSSALIYMGDSDVDMMTARNAGMHGVGVSWGFRSREELLQNGAGIIVDHPGQLPAFFSV